MYGIIKAWLAATNNASQQIDISKSINLIWNSDLLSGIDLRM